MIKIKFIITVLIFFGLNLIVFADEALPDDAQAVIENLHGNNVKAMELIEKAIKESSHESDYMLYNTRGTIKEHMEDYDGAMQDYSKALSINHEYGTAYYNRANLYAGMKQYDKALNDFNSAIKYSPEHSENYNNRGLLKRDLGDYKGAMYDFMKVIELSPEDENGYYNRGYTYFMQEKLENAIADFSTAIKKQAQNPDAYFYRGISKAALGYKNDGLSDINIAKTQYLELGYTDGYQNCINVINKIEH